MTRVSALVMFAATGTLSTSLFSCAREGDVEMVNSMAVTSSNTPTGQGSTAANASGNVAQNQNTGSQVNGSSSQQTSMTSGGQAGSDQTTLQPPANQNTGGQTTSGGTAPQPPTQNEQMMAGSANTGDPQTQDMGSGGAQNQPPVDQSEGGTMTAGGAGNDGDPMAMGGSGTEMQPDVDQNGKTNAVLGDSTSVAQDYLRLGDIRIINNNWGSEDLNCSSSTMSVFVHDDSRFGWDFNRGDCASETDSSHPDFPQLEFGIHPFGIGSDLATSPDFSSTTVLPMQIGQITSASVTLEDLQINLQGASSWDITMEFWLSEGDPLQPNPGVYAEIMTFWGWQGGRWPSAPGADGASDGGSGTGDNVSAGSKSYTLWVQRDNWASGWRYFQFRADDGPQQNFSGTVDVKALLDYLKGRGYPDTLWLSRMEVGSEIDDNTSGSVSMSGVTFEVNGESHSQVLGQ